MAVLEGGLPAWKAEGRPLETSPVSDRDREAPALAAASPPASSRYKARLQVFPTPPFCPLARPAGRGGETLIFKLDSTSDFLCSQHAGVLSLYSRPMMTRTRWWRRCRIELGGVME